MLSRLFCQLQTPQYPINIQISTEYPHLFAAFKALGLIYVSFMAELVYNAGIVTATI